ncbi:MAG TPA: TIGR04211 family SH3 domain-containing protein [Solimonas sp.]|nr:TIGR04211 family SH3 domain-containing protein [Solimonas sp.]
MMIRTLLLALALGPCLLGSAPAAAQAGREQYISDEISVTIRQEPRSDAPSLGVLKSGAKVTVLEVLGADSFARIRTPDGREGWITARFLSTQPAAKDRTNAIRAELDQARERAQALEKELALAREQLSRAQPALELAQDKERLQAQIVQLEQHSAQLTSRYDAESARRRTLATGAGLIVGGVFLGLVLPWLASGRRRRYSEF